MALGVLWRGVGETEEREGTKKEKRRDIVEVDELAARRYKLFDGKAFAAEVELARGALSSNKKIHGETAD